MFDLFNTNTPTSAPVNTSGMTLLCSLEPANFDALTKILAFLQDSDAIVIKDSKIVQSLKKGSTILYTDISQAARNANLNFTVLNPRQHLKRFKFVKGNRNVDIFDDVEHQRYIISNGDVKLLLPKQLKDLEVTPADIPDFNGIVKVGNSIKLNSDYSSNIRSLIGSSQIDLLFEGEQLKALYIENEVIYTFNDYVGKTNIDENNNDLMLRSFTPLCVNGEEYEISIAKKSDLDYWIFTKVNTGLVEVQIFEKTQPVTNTNLLL
jgi:hypothetical protein